MGFMGKESAQGLIKHKFIDEYFHSVIYANMIDDLNHCSLIFKENVLFLEFVKQVSRGFGHFVNFYVSRL